MIDTSSIKKWEVRAMAEKAVSVLYDAYNATLDDTPAVTIHASIEAQGLDMTRYASIASAPAAQGRARSVVSNALRTVIFPPAAAFTTRARKNRTTSPSSSFKTVRFM